MQTFGEEKLAKKHVVKLEWWNSEIWPFGLVKVVNIERLVNLEGWSTHWGLWVLINRRKKIGTGQSGQHTECGQVIKCGQVDGFHCTVKGVPKFYKNCIYPWKTVKHIVVTLLWSSMVRLNGLCTVCCSSIQCAAVITPARRPLQLNYNYNVDGFYMKISIVKKLQMHT